MKDTQRINNTVHSERDTCEYYTDNAVVLRHTLDRNRLRREGEPFRTISCALIITVVSFHAFPGYVLFIFGAV